MNMEKEYLSDEELYALIDEVEQNDMVMAPPDIKDEIMAEIEQNEKEKQKAPVPIADKRNSQREFARYCLRVLTSVAAAIVMAFLLPEFTALETTEIPTKQEILASEKYETKEEALDETGPLTKLLGRIGILKQDIKLDFFNDKNGG